MSKSAAKGSAWVRRTSCHSAPDCRLVADIECFLKDQPDGQQLQGRGVGKAVAFGRELDVPGKLRPASKREQKLVKIGARVGA